MKLFILNMLFFSSMPLIAVEQTPDSSSKGKIHYEASKAVEFDKLLIQGELKRPDLSVVTGNVVQGGDGLLRLRQNFVDRLEADLGVEKP